MRGLWRLSPAPEGFETSALPRFEASLKPGSYEATLKVGSGNCVSTDTKRFEIVQTSLAMAPIPDVTCVNENLGTATIQLDASGSRTEGGGPLEYSWTVTAPGISLFHRGVSFTPTLGPGEYHVKLTAGVPECGPETLEDDFVVSRAPRIVYQRQIISPTDPDGNFTVQYSSEGSEDLDGDAFTLTWAVVGTAASDAGSTFEVSLPSGQYQVNIRATDAHGCTSALTDFLDTSIVPPDKRSTTLGSDPRQILGLKGSTIGSDGQSKISAPPGDHEKAASKSGSGFSVCKPCEQCAGEDTTQDPVHLPTGTLLEFKADLALETLGCQMKLVRVYRSDRLTTGSLGIGWRHVFERRLEIRPGSVTEVDELEARNTFLSDPLGGFRNSSGNAVRLEQHEDGGFSTIYATDTRFRYLPDGRLHSISERNGNTITLHYSDDQALRKVTSSSGRELVFEIENGRLRRLSVPGLHLVQYAYEGDQLRALVDTLGQTVLYGYTPEGRLTLIRYSDGSQTENRYEEGRVIEQVQKDGTTGQTSTTRLEYLPEGIRRLLDPLGGITEYQFDTRGLLARRKASDGAEQIFERNAQGQLTAIVHPDGRREAWNYTPDGKPYLYTSRGQEVTLVDRDPVSGDPSGLILPDGAEERREFSPTGNVSATVDPGGRVILYEYTSTGDLKRILEPDGGSTEMVYDDNGQVAATIDGLGQRTEFRRDELGQVVETASPEGRTHRTEYEGGTFVKAQIDALNQRTNFERDAAGRLAATVLPNGARTQHRWATINGQDVIIESTNPMGAMTRTEHDPMGHATATIDPLGRRTAFIRDPRGRVTKTTYPDGTTSQSFYTITGLLDRTVDSIGRETRFRYDAEDRLVETILPDGSSSRSEFDVMGRVVKSIAPDGATQETLYNRNGEVVGSIDALGNASQSFYGPGGNLERMVDALGRESRLEHDALDRVTKTITAMGFTSETEFDADGNTRMRIDAGGHAVVMVFDALNRPIEVKDPLGHSVKTSYDSVGNVIRIEDENHNSWTMEFDLAGRKTKETDPNGRSVTFTWDLAGQWIHQAFQDGSSIAQAHDVMGRVIERVYRRPDGSTEDVDTMEYDIAGRRVLVENAAARIQSSYDLMDREVTRRVLFKKSGILRTLAFSHDVMGRRTAMVDDTGRMLRYAYDLLGRLVKLEVMEPMPEKEKHCKVRICHVPPGNPQGAHEIEVDLKALLAHLAHGDRMNCGGQSPPPATGFNTRTYTFAWDAVSNLVETVYPNLTRTRRSYDDDNRLTEIVHEQLGSGGNVVNVLESFTYQRDADGLIESITEADGDVWTYRHDAKHQLTRQEMPMRLFRELTRGRAGRGGGGEDDDDDGDHGDDGGHGGGGDHGHEPAGGVPDIARVTEWVLDPAGNRIQEKRDGRSIASTYSAANELLTSGELRFENDARGNQISKQQGNGPKERFFYNVASKLISYGKEEPGKPDKGKKGRPVPPVVKELERYFYSPGSERVGVLDVTKGELTEFLWEGGRPIEEFVVTKGKKDATAKGIRYAWGMGGMIEQQAVTYNAAIPVSPAGFLLGEAGAKAGARQHGASDHLGSIRLLTDEVGRPVERTSWGAWGESLEGGLRSRFGFTGHQTERASGHRYSVYRFLDPRQGRWNQRDPLGDGDGQNRYTYVRNRPVNLIDELGLAAWGAARGWQHSDEAEFRSWILQNAGFYMNQTSDCADLSISMLIDFAEERGLPVAFRASPLLGLRRMISYSDPMFSNAQQFKFFAQRRLSSNMLWDYNTYEYAPFGGGTDPRPGDLLMKYGLPAATGPLPGHTAIFLDRVHGAGATYRYLNASLSQGQPTQAEIRVKTVKELSDLTSIRWWTDEVLLRNPDDCYNSGSP